MTDIFCAMKNPRKDATQNFSGTMVLICRTLLVRYLSQWKFHTVTRHACNKRVHPDRPNPDIWISLKWVDYNKIRSLGCDTRFACVSLSLPSWPCPDINYTYMQRALMGQSDILCVMLQPVIEIQHSKKSIMNHGDLLPSKLCIALDNMSYV